MKKVLITGAAGFIGRELYKHLESLQYDVYGTKTGETVGRILKCDITNAQDVNSVFDKVQPDIVIHAAAIASVTSGATLEYYDINTRGTEHIIAAMNRGGERKRFIFLSTAAVYGNQEVDVLHEKLCPQPVSHYGCSKFVAERLTLNEADNHDVTILRLFNVVGAHQKGSFIVPKLVHHFNNKIPQIELGNIEPERDYLPISSVVNFIALFINNNKSFGEVVNVAAGMGTSVKKLIDILTEITGHDIEIVKSPKFMRKNEVWRMIGCTKKIKSLLRTEIPETDLRQLLTEILVEYAEADKPTRVL